MPLVVGITIPPPPVPEPSIVPAAQPVIDPVGRPRTTWTDPDGDVWELTGPHEVHGWFTTQAIGGWGAASVDLVTDPQARGGVVVRHARRMERRLTWPLHIFGDTHMEFVTRNRALMRAFTMTSQRQRPGTLTVYRPDTTARAIDCWYEGGWEGNAVAGEDVVYANPVLTLFCPDGFWRDVEPERVSRSYAVGDTPFLDPYLTISSSRVLGATTVANGGDVEAWPKWTITGPISALVATNHTLGAAFTLTYGLAAGETITITTNLPAIRGPGGQNLASALNWPAAELWPLAPGNNNVTFAATGADAGTEIELEFYPRYEAA